MTSKGIPLPYLRAWRNSKYLMQKELADKSGVTETTISRLENGEPARIDTIAKLAAALGVSREQLIKEAPKELAAV